MNALVIGTGICGLTAAYTLHRQGIAVTVLEAGDRPGGLIHTQQAGGYLFENGPNTFPSMAAELMQLCTELGVTPTPTSTSARKRYLYYQGRLQALPGRPFALIGSSVFSGQAKLRLLQEPWISRNRKPEPTVAEFFTHRLGTELTEALADPFISGIYAGDIHQLSLPAVFPKLWDWEQAHGSLIRGAMANRREKSAHGGRKPRYRLMSFPGGMETLTSALAAQLPSGTIRLRTRAGQITQNPEGYTVLTETGQRFSAQKLILAIPAYAAADLLRPLSDPLTQALDGIPYAPMQVVHTGFLKNALPKNLDGFGFLVPRREQLPLLGSIWSSSLFPERAPEGHVLLSNFIGGAHHRDISDWPDGRVIETVIDNLRTVFKAPGLQPSFTSLWRSRRAIPQYTTGHLERVQKINVEIAPLPGLALTGNYLTGIALNECVKNAQAAAQKIMQANY